MSDRELEITIDSACVVASKVKRGRSKVEVWYGNILFDITEKYIVIATLLH